LKSLEEISDLDNNVQGKKFHPNVDDNDVAL
jgi:hypothetical protein